MKEKTSNPKKLAIATIIILCIYMIFNIVNYGGFLIYSGLNLVNLISYIISNLFSYIFYGYAYFILYLLIVVFAKRKSMKALNIILIVQLFIAIGISGISFLINLYDFVRYGTLYQLLNIFSQFLFIIPFVLLLIMTFGILLKKKMTYKILLWLIVGCIGFSFAINLLSSVLNIIRYNYYTIYYGCTALVSLSRYIAICLFAGFMYQYGKSID